VAEGNGCLSPENTASDGKKKKTTETAKKKPEKCFQKLSAGKRRSPTGGLITPRKQEKGSCLNSEVNLRKKGHWPDTRKNFQSRGGAGTGGPPKGKKKPRKHETEKK